MPIIAQATLFFDQGTYNAGWTEVYYLSTNDINTAFTAANGMAVQRGKMLGSDVTLAQLRVSDTAVTGDSLVRTFANGEIPGQTNNAAEPWTCLLLRMQATALFRRSLYLRGLPENIFNDANLPPLAGAVPNFNQWVDTLLASGFGVRSFRRAPANPATALGSILNDVAPLRIISIAHGLATNDHIKIKGCAWRAANGIHKVSVIDADTFALIGVDFVPVSIQPGSGTWQRVVYDVQPFTLVSIQRVDKRDTGRPFDVRRGRRRVLRN